MSRHYDKYVANNAEYVIEWFKELDGNLRTLQKLLNTNGNKVSIQSFMEDSFESIDRITNNDRTNISVELTKTILSESEEFVHKSKDLSIGDREEWMKKISSMVSDKIQDLENFLSLFYARRVFGGWR